MSDRRTPRRSPPTWTLTLVLSTAVSFGIVAVLLSGTPPTLPTGYAPTLSSPWQVPVESVGLVGLLLVFAWLGYRIYLRLMTPTVGYPGPALLTILSLFLVTLLFLALLHLVGTGSPNPTHPVVPQNQTTGPPPPVAKANNSSLNWTHQGALPGLPTWAPYALLGIAVAIAALGAFPYLLVRADRLADERGRTAGVERARTSVRVALERLGPGRATDPRSVIIALYQDLLAAVAPGVGAVGPKTAREIERACVDALGVGPATARELTSLFEEARYSTRPMGAGAADRAARSLADALADLSRSRGPA